MSGCELDGDPGEVDVPALRRAALVAHADQGAGEDAERRDQGEPEADLAAVGFAGEVEHSDQDEDHAEQAEEGDERLQRERQRRERGAWRSRSAPRSPRAASSARITSRTENASQPVVVGSPYQRQEERRPGAAARTRPRSTPPRAAFADPLTGRNLSARGGSRRRRPRAEGCLGTAAGDGARRSTGEGGRAGCSYAASQPRGSQQQAADPRIEGTASRTSAERGPSQTRGHADRLRRARSDPSPAGGRRLSGPGGHGDRRARPASDLSSSNRTWLGVAAVLGVYAVVLGAALLPAERLGRL